MCMSGLEWFPIIYVGSMQRIFIIDGFIYVVLKDLFDETVIQLSTFNAAVLSARIYEDVVAAFQTFQVNTKTLLLCSLLLLEHQ